jgi:hypothetical protein
MVEAHGGGGIAVCSDQRLDGWVQEPFLAYGMGHELLREQVGEGGWVCLGTSFEEELHLFAQTGEDLGVMLLDSLSGVAHGGTCAFQSGGRQRKRASAMARAVLAAGSRRTSRRSTHLMLV